MSEVENVDESSENETFSIQSGSDDADSEIQILSGSEQVFDVLDQEGRINNTSDIGLNFSTLGWNIRNFSASDDEPSSLLTAQRRERTFLEKFRDDCAVVYDGATTFWVQPNDKPTCALESLALAILEKHTSNVKSKDSCYFGAEWWVQVREDSSNSDPPMLDQDDNIIFHWDKDEELVDEQGVNVHPQISTVTYLTNSGQPTFVFNKRAPQMYDDFDALYNATDGDDDSDPTSGKHVWICYPHVGRHLSFDGRYLHGCPAEFRSAVKGPRVTFLCNIWVNHIPEGVERFEDKEKLDALQLASEVEFDFLNGNVLPVDFSTIEKGLDKTSGLHDIEQASALFGPCKVDHKLIYPVPRKYLKSVSYLNKEKELPFLHIFSKDTPIVITPYKNTILKEVPRLHGPNVSWKQIVETYRDYRLLILDDVAADDTDSVFGTLENFHKVFLSQKESLSLSSEDQKSLREFESAFAVKIKTKLTGDGEQDSKRLKRSVEDEEKPFKAVFTFDKASYLDHATDFESFLKDSVNGFWRSVLPSDGCGVSYSNFCLVHIGKNINGRSIEIVPRLNDSINEARQRNSSAICFSQGYGSTEFRARLKSSKRWMDLPFISSLELYDRDGLEFTVKRGSILLFNLNLWSMESHVAKAAKDCVLPDIYVAYLQNMTISGDRSL